MMIGVVATIFGPQAVAQKPAGAPSAEWPQADYFERVMLSSPLVRGPVRPNRRFEALKLAPGVEPEILVLPVQQQASGWSPSVTAIIGAKLDHELALRDVRANRQVDLFDVDGPFARRFSKEAVRAFNGEHGNRRILALYVGRDGKGQAFVTLTSDTRGNFATAHRTIAEASAPSPLVEALGRTLPEMLTELGIPPSPNPPARRPAKACDTQVWNVSDTQLRAPGAMRTCTDFAMGVLLPDHAGRADAPSSRSPAKVNWLASAYVNADDLEGASADAIRSIAWDELELTSARGAALRNWDIDDPVIRPLARALAAEAKVELAPARAPDRARMEYATAAAQPLPAFSRAVFIERALHGMPFRRVDMCAILAAMPSMRAETGCAKNSPRGIPSYLQASMVAEWRIASAITDIEIEGNSRADEKARLSVLARLPSDVAEHPFVRHARFMTTPFSKTTGSYEDLVQQAAREASLYLQGTLDAQRLDSFTFGWKLIKGFGTGDDALVREPAISPLVAKDAELAEELSYDGFKTRDEPLRMWIDPKPLAIQRASQAPLSPPASFAQQDAGAKREPLQPSLPAAFAVRYGGGLRSDLSDPELEQEIGLHPGDVDVHLEKALRQMKAGQPAAQARLVLDSRSPDCRTTSRLCESHALGRVAGALLFAGEIDSARHYLVQSVAMETGSAPEMQDEVSLRLIDGDVRAALAASLRLLRRYEGDAARRQVAGLEFMAGERDQAWAVLNQRLATTANMALWQGSSVGHRMEGRGPAYVQAWIAKSGYDHVSFEGAPLSAIYLSRYMSEDRAPSDEDIKLLTEARKETDRQMLKPAEALVRLQQLAFRDRVVDADLQPVRELLASFASTQGDHSASVLEPLYVWSAWRASDGKDPALEAFRRVDLRMDIDSLLAKAIVVGLDGNATEAAKYLRAARVELAGLALGTINNPMRSLSYSAALTSYLMYGASHEQVYRNEALRLARTYQIVFPYYAWPYALEASLSDAGVRRIVAACRAARLDPASEFLRMSKLTVQWDSPACAAAHW